MPYIHATSYVQTMATTTTVNIIYTCNQSHIDHGYYYNCIMPYIHTTSYVQTMATTITVSMS